MSLGKSAEVVSALSVDHDPNLWNHLILRRQVPYAKWLEVPLTFISGASPFFASECENTKFWHQEPASLEVANLLQSEERCFFSLVMNRLPLLLS